MSNGFHRPDAFRPAEKVSLFGGFIVIFSGTHLDNLIGGCVLPERMAPMLTFRGIQKTKLFYALLALQTSACIPETSETIEVTNRMPSNGVEERNNPSPSPARGGGTHRTPATAPEPDNLNGQPSAPEPETPADETHTNQRLASWFSVRSNYDLVYKDVLTFYPEGRYNGCVAFLSAALRRIDVYIPLRTATESPSLITKPFSRYLEYSLGWNRIGGAQNLRRGDVVFTTDNASYPGYPAHTYMFLSWSDKTSGLALVIDNQDFTHERNIYSTVEGFNFTPYAYALRAP